MFKNFHNRFIEVKNILKVYCGYIRNFSYFDLIKKIYKSKIIISFLIISVIIGSFITIGGFSKNLYGFYYGNIAIAKNISNNIKLISPGQSINYFREIFGAEMTSKKLTDTEEELIFKYKTSYIQTIVNKNDVVMFFSITDCKNPVKIINRSFVGIYSRDDEIFPSKIILNKTTFNNFFRNNKEKMYFISGATANSYYYEYQYLGNPSNYQTLFVGRNDICGGEYFNKLSPIDEDNKDEDISNFRNTTTITTYGESAPFEGDKIINLLKESEIYLGPDRIIFRTFLD